MSMNTKRISTPILTAILAWVFLCISAAHAEGGQTNLTTDERVSSQRAVEEVYWWHRIWPKENPQPKPALDGVMPLSVIRAKVEDYLRKSEALRVYWQRPITGEQLQAEMDRMARQTRQPGMLRDVWAALGNDPYVIAECLARPALVNRLLRNWYAQDERFHGDLKRHAEAELRAHATVSQLQQMSGEYREVEWAREESSEPGVESWESRRGYSQLTSPNREAVVLSSEQWDEKVRELEQTYSSDPSAMNYEPSTVQRTRNMADGFTPNPERGTPNYRLPLGQLSRVQEAEDRFYVVAVLEQWQGRLKVASVEWKKEPFDTWWQKAQANLGMPLTGPTHTYRLAEPDVRSASCTEDTWRPTQPPLVRSRWQHTAVWTGSEMIVWGGVTVNGFGGFNTGGRYDPATDSWVATSTTNAPSHRQGHTAVWTGDEMIVWGGGLEGSGVNTGGRYDPATDAWIATSTTNVPSGRFGHTAIWTGSEMIVWGGRHLNTGGRYDPVTDTWVATQTTGAPSGRSLHAAVWTGKEMIVWGGGIYPSPPLNTGGRYDPAKDSWVATTTVDAPSGRANKQAVWTGKEMIIWGGCVDQRTYCIALDTGGRYDPAKDHWVATSLSDVPASRYGHTTVWTGKEMIIWGGFGINPRYILNTGGRYDPVMDSWVATTPTNAPDGRALHTAIWSGSEMIVWGASANTGGRYDPVTDSWVATSVNSPSPRQFHTAVWTGSEMIVWGGRGLTNTGDRYNPATDSWLPTNTTNAPSLRTGHTAIWTGAEMIVWGGSEGFPIRNAGGRYDPARDSWTATSTTDAPSAQSNHTAVWTGREMIVWGGSLSDQVNTGGRYDPATDSWVATSTTKAPSPRSWHTAVWTGSEMIVWGGRTDVTHFNTGGRYHLGTDTWVATSTIDAPDRRFGHTAVWTGREMIVWAGIPGAGRNTGGRYDPTSDSWIPTNVIGAPVSPRQNHTAVWTGAEMIVWGGVVGLFVPGGRYSPDTDSWTRTSFTNGPRSTYGHTAVWTGSEMIVWGGEGQAGEMGGRYCASTGSSAENSASQ